MELNRPPVGPQWGLVWPYTSVGSGRVGGVRGWALRPAGRAVGCWWGLVCCRGGAVGGVLGVRWGWLFPFLLLPTFFYSLLLRAGRDAVVHRFLAESITSYKYMRIPSEFLRPSIIERQTADRFSLALQTFLCA